MYQSIFDFIWVFLAARARALLAPPPHLGLPVCGRFIKKGLSVLLAGLMLSPCAPLFAHGPSGQDRRAARVKAALLKLGTGRDSRVAVVLQDKDNGSGYLIQAGENSFVLSNFCTDTAARIAYEEVRSLRGVNIATGSRVSVGKGVPRRDRVALRAIDPCRRTVSIIETKGRMSGREWLTWSRVVVMVATAALTIGLLVKISNSND